MHNGKYQCHNNGSKLHIPPTNYHLLAAQQEPYKKLTRNEILEFSGEEKKKSGEWTISSKMTRQKEQEDYRQKKKEKKKKKGEKKREEKQTKKRERGDRKALIALRFQTGVEHKTALRFQTGGEQKTSPASLRGRAYQPDVLLMDLHI